MQQTNKFPCIFKGKSLDTGRWVTGYGMVMTPDRQLANIFHRQGINLMQATAVNPKTVSAMLFSIGDTPFFEGDIVGFDVKHSWEEAPIFQNQNGVVSWQNGEVLIGNWFLRLCTNIVLLSNIHDNPDYSQSKQ